MALPLGVVVHRPSTLTHNSLPTKATLACRVEGRSLGGGLGSREGAGGQGPRLQDPRSPPVARRARRK